MEQTVQQAEEAEPLLAQKLYDTYRKAKQQKVEERVKVTEQLLDRNMDAEARRMADESMREVTELRTEIDQAAEALWAMKRISLRLALNQIQTLEQQLNNERPDRSPQDSRLHRMQASRMQADKIVATQEGEPQRQLQQD